jgi:oligoribonuclease (3'-5' exoribonuclease)
MKKLFLKEEEELVEQEKRKNELMLEEVEKSNYQFERIHEENIIYSKSFISPASEVIINESIFPNRELIIKNVPSTVKEIRIPMISSRYLIHIVIESLPELKLS